MGLDFERGPAPVSFWGSQANCSSCPVDFIPKARGRGAVAEKEARVSVPCHVGDLCADSAGQYDRLHTMDRTLHEHILYLEHRIQSLRDQLTESHRTAGERERVGAEIKVAELALAHYRAAYDLEKGLM